MDEANLEDKYNFFYPRNRYYGQMKRENLVFNTNLQEFAQKVGYISVLESNGQLDSSESCNQIKALWKQFKDSQKELGITKSSPSA